MKTTVIITHRQIGFHCWPEAPATVDYLSDRHRHLFLIIVGWDVADDDRQVEFHLAQAQVRRMFLEVADFGHRSCEMIAKDLYADLIGSSDADGRTVPAPSFIEVWEDEECGSRVEFP